MYEMILLFRPKIRLSINLSAYIYNHSIALTSVSADVMRFERSEVKLWLEFVMKRDLLGHKSSFGM